MAPVLFVFTCLGCSSPQDTPPGQAGKLVREVAPIYPKAARAAGVHGDAVLHAVINEDGTIRELTSAGGHPLLIPAAMDAVKEWVYVPYVKDGARRAVDTNITVHFDLKRPMTP